MAVQFNGHGVGVVEENAAGSADVGDVAGDRDDGGNGAEAAEDAADAEGIADGLEEAVLAGNLEIDDGAGLVAADLDGADNIAGAADGFALVEGGLDAGLDLEGVDHAVGHDLGDLEAVGIDVLQAEGGAGELGELEDVAEEVFGENDGAGADEGNLEGHGTKSRDWRRPKQGEKCDLTIAFL